MEKPASKDYNSYLAFWRRLEPSRREFLYNPSEPESIDACLVLLKAATADIIDILDRQKSSQIRSRRQALNELILRLSPSDGTVLKCLYYLALVGGQERITHKIAKEIDFHIYSLFASLADSSSGSLHSHFRYAYNIGRSFIRPYFSNSVLKKSLDLGGSIADIRTTFSKCVSVIEDLAEQGKTLDQCPENNPCEATKPPKLKKSCTTKDLQCTGKSYYEHQKVALRLKTPTGKCKDFRLYIERNQFRRNSVGYSYKLNEQKYLVSHKYAIAFIDCLIKANLDAKYRKDSEPRYCYVPIVIKESDGKKGKGQSFTASCFNDKDEYRDNGKTIIKKSRSFWKDLIDSKPNNKAGQQAVRLKLPTDEDKETVKE